MLKGRRSSNLERVDMATKAKEEERRHQKERELTEWERRRKGSSLLSRLQKQF